jgi:2-polyprenyl-3-methyl-5-hydroxy-6-metoxy-1,4-benzoquinol methylase
MDESINRTIHNPRITIESYKKHSFESLRIESITEQLRLISNSGYTNVLEIGTAGGFLKHCFKLFPHISHTTIDIAEELTPDYIGSVVEMPFKDKQFDLIVCCEVLEHLPFDDFLPSLQEIRRVTRHEAIISMPDSTRHFGIAVCLARFGWFRFEWNPKRRSNTRRKVDYSICQHYWEIGYKGSEARDVVSNIKKAGFKIKEQYRLSKHDWHRFFILQA